MSAYDIEDLKYLYECGEVSKYCSDILTYIALFCFQFIVHLLFHRSMRVAVSFLMLSSFSFLTSDWSERGINTFQLFDFIWDNYTLCRLFEKRHKPQIVNKIGCKAFNTQLVRIVRENVW